MGALVTAAALTAERGSGLLDALGSRIPGARAHADAVALYSFGIAVELGLQGGRCETIAEAARLHEVGKLYVPEELLRDSPPLSNEEQVRLDAHPDSGYGLLLGAGVPPSPATWVLHQAERFDGTGPAALAGEAIPLESRIIAVACTYHTWSGSITRDLALAELHGAAGVRLDPTAAAALGAVVARAAPRSGGTSHV